MQQMLSQTNDSSGVSRAYAARANIDESYDEEECSSEYVTMTSNKDDQSRHSSHTCLFDKSSASNQDSPEALVQPENQAFRIVRVLLASVLLVAALGTAFSMFWWSRRSEESSFASEYVSISDFIVGVLIDDMARFMWAGNAAAGGVAMAMGAYNVNSSALSIPYETWNNFARPLLVATGSAFVTWSPLLRNDDERSMFESFVTDLEDDRYFTGGAFPPCYICGTPQFRVLNPESEVDFPGIGFYSCGFLEETGSTGGLPSSACPAIIPIANKTCQCGLVADTSPKEVRLPSQGIFQYDLSSDTYETDYSMIDAPWNGGPYLPMFQDGFMRSNQIGRQL
jgi:hypothetical protein